MLVNDPGGDVEKQTAFIDDVVTLNKADGILICVVEEEAMVPACERAENAGIPVVAWDPELRSDEVTSVVHHKPNSPVGTECVGQYFVDKAQELGIKINVLEVWGPTQFLTVHERHEGFHSVVDQYPDLISVIESTEAEGSDQKAASVVMDQFTAHSELNGIFCSDGGGTGAIQGLQAIDRLKPYGTPEHVTLGFNDIDTVTIEALLDGNLDAVATHVPYDMNNLAVQVMYHHLILGNTVPQNIILPMKLVTQENVHTLQLWGLPAAYPLLPQGEWDLWPAMDFSSGGLLLSVNGPEYSLEIPTKAMRMENKGY